MTTFTTWPPSWSWFWWWFDNDYLTQENHRGVGLSWTACAGQDYCLKINNCSHRLSLYPIWSLHCIVCHSLTHSLSESSLKRTDLWVAGVSLNANCLLRNLDQVIVSELWKSAQTSNQRIISAENTRKSVSVPLVALLSSSQPLSLSWVLESCLRRCKGSPRWELDPRSSENWNYGVWSLHAWIQFLSWKIGNFFTSGNYSLSCWINLA